MSEPASRELDVHAGQTTEFSLAIAANQLSPDRPIANGRFLRTLKPASCQELTLVIMVERLT
jgi:hypothetical protein